MLKLKLNLLLNQFQLAIKQFACKTEAAEALQQHQQQLNPETEAEIESALTYPHHISILLSLSLSLLEMR